MERNNAIAHRTALARSRGRRGARARARQARIDARRASGTYRQPSGGVITNS